MNSYNTSINAKCQFLHIFKQNIVAYIKKKQ